MREFQSGMFKWFVSLLVLCIISCASSPFVRPAGGSSNDDGYVVDSRTKVLWQIKHSPVELTYEEAQNYCASLVLDGQKDWMLPSILSLASISTERLYNFYIAKPGGGTWEQRAGRPFLDRSVFRGPGMYFWSKTERGSDKTMVWKANYGDGHLFPIPKSSKLYARCIRSGGGTFQQKSSGESLIGIREVDQLTGKIRPGDYQHLTFLRDDKAASIDVATFQHVMPKWEKPASGPCRQSTETAVYDYFTKAVALAAAEKRGVKCPTLVSTVGKSTVKRQEKNITMINFVDSGYVDVQCENLPRLVIAHSKDECEAVK